MARETHEAYKRRILSYVAGEDPLEIQASTYDRLQELLRGTAPATLTRRPSPGKWSILEIVAHLAEDELVGAYRIRRILASPGTPIEAFDQDRWAISGKYADRELASCLELFRVLRKSNLDLFRTLDAAQWKRHGVHAERGVESVADIAEYYAGHDLNHLGQIQAILDAPAATL